MSTDSNLQYRQQDLKKTWSYAPYKKYETAASTWNWSNLPFRDPMTAAPTPFVAPDAPIKGSILEVGSACGGAYQFIKSSGMVDVSDYTGVEISNYGNSFCKEHYPEATWVQADFTQYRFDRTYDYVFERIAVHHMPDPLAQYDKILAATGIAFSTSFVSCLNGRTISDMNIARYEHFGSGSVYFDIINPFEVIELGLKRGFNVITFYYGDEHENVPRDPYDHQYISPDIDIRARVLSRTTLTLRRDPRVTGIHWEFFGPLDHRKPFHSIMKFIPRYARRLKVNNVIKARLKALAKSFEETGAIHYYLPNDLV